MAETLDTLATKIDALGVVLDKRFEQVDKRLEQVDRRFEHVEQTFRTVFEQFDALKAQLTIKIEVVDSKVGLLLERVDDFLKRDVANSAEHARMDTRIDAHDLRITALERGDRRKAH